MYTNIQGILNYSINTQTIRYGRSRDHATTSDLRSDVTMIIFAVLLLLATRTVRADPCAFFEVEFGNKYNVKPNPDSLIRATRTYPQDGDQCAIINRPGCCTTDGKYMSIHTEILNNNRPKEGETGEALYVATFAAPEGIAKYTNVSDFSIVEVKPHGFKYKICYRSINPLSGKVTPKLLIRKDDITDIKDNNNDDGTSLIGKQCKICPLGVTSPPFSGDGTSTLCGPAFMWDPFRDGKHKHNECYPMKSPSLMTIYPVCADQSGKATSVVRFRSFACQETSDTGYRVSGRAVLTGTTVHVDACFIGTGQ